MKLRFAAVLPVLLAMTLSLHASQDADATPTPSLMSKTLEILHLKRTAKPKTARETHSGVEVKLAIDPIPVKLSTTREIKVTVSLINWTKGYVHYDFPTSQRIEILVRDSSGKVINIWSEDQSFTNDPATVTVNPGERLEYTASVPTREMAEGQTYAVEASFPSYPNLKGQEQVVPEK
jgi:hypothetical protein